MFQCEKKKKSVNIKVLMSLNKKGKALSCSGTTELHPVLTTRHQQGEF